MDFDEEFLKKLRFIEEKWQNKWEKSGIFIGKMNKTKPKYFITVPYPYASGPLHIGHCRTYNLGDIFARYKRQQGFNVIWPMAFHITGIPVLSISKRIQKKEKKILDLYRSYIGIYEDNKKDIEQIINSFIDPMNVASYFAGKLMDDFKRMGFSIDSTRQFTTADAEYNRFIEWQYKILNEKGLITQGTYPILWCTNCNNAVGEDDIQGGDETKVEVTEFTGIKFKMAENAYLIAATLRPETIFGATNVWIHPNAVYQEIKVDDKENWIVSKEASFKLSQQSHLVEFIREFKGETLLDKTAEIPVVGKKIPIYPAEFVDPTHATGIVYSVPAHAPFDYVALVDLQQNSDEIKKYNLNLNRLNKIKPISIISLKDYGEFPAVEICSRMEIKNQTEIDKLEEATKELYRAEFYSGILKPNTGDFRDLKVDIAKEKAAVKLLDENLAAKFYEVSTKSLCRCGGKVLVAVISDQYFLNYGDKNWNDTAFNALNNMTIIPDKFRQSFENTFHWLDKRPCVRKRGLGTEFPMTKGKGWIIESLSDSVIYMAFYTIIKIIRQNKIHHEQLIPAVFDYIFLNKGDLQKVSKISQIPKNTLDEMKNEFEYWYPNDFRHTAISHISNHLSFAIFHHAAIFPEKHWIKSISLNDMLIRDGQKMGKSKGNVIPIAEIPVKYSVDLARFHLSSIASVDSVIDWRDEDVMNSLKKIKKFWEYSEQVKSAVMVDIAYSHPTRMFLSAVKVNINKSIEAIDEFNVREYIQYCFFRNVQEMNRYSKLIETINREEFNSAIKKVIQDIILVLAPVIPHVCEEIHELFQRSKKEPEFISIMKIPKYVLTADDQKLALQSSFLSELVEDIDQILNLTGKIPSKIHIYIGPKWKNTLYENAKDLFAGEAFEIGKIMKEMGKKVSMKSHMKGIAKEAKIMAKNPSIFRISMLDPEEQKGAILGYSDFIKKKYQGIEIFAYIGEEKGIYDPENKRIKSRPMKPAIYIE